MQMVQSGHQRSLARWCLRGGHVSFSLLPLSCAMGSEWKVPSPVFLCRVIFSSSWEWGELVATYSDWITRVKWLEVVHDANTEPKGNLSGFKGSAEQGLC